MSNGSMHQPESHSLSPIYHLENPARWPWDDVVRVLASVLPRHIAGQAPRLPLIPYSTWLDRVVHLGDTTTDNRNGANSEQQNTILAASSLLATEETIPQSSSPPSKLSPSNPPNKDFHRNNNPAYNLAEFFATDFIRMACGSIVLETRLACEASASLREFSSVASDVAVRDEILERYVGFWRGCGFI